MSSNSPVHELLGYRQERLPARLCLPLTLLLFLASLAGGWPASVIDFVVSLVLAGTLVCQFRLWDDLADLPSDRICHPERVLSRADSLIHFRLVLLLALIANAGLIALVKSTDRFLVFCTLSAVLLLWYRSASSRRWRVIGYHVVLIKYPVIVYLVGSSISPASRFWMSGAMALVYLGVCVYEVLHDARLRAVLMARWMVLLEMSALAGVVVLMVLGALT